MSRSPTPQAWLGWLLNRRGEAPEAADLGTELGLEVSMLPGEGLDIPPRPPAARVSGGWLRRWRRSRHD